MQTSIPIASPLFSSIQPSAPPMEFGSCAISPHLWGIMDASTAFSIRQHVKLLPKVCCGCPPCLEQENTYSIYAGLNRDAQAEILRIDEVSDSWNRCCCSPNHPLRLEMRQYIPVPGDGSDSDYSHLSQDFINDFNRFTGADQSGALLHLYQERSPVLLSMVRHDGMRCCRCPCKCLACCICNACCIDGISLYAGEIHDDTRHNEIGRIENHSHLNSQRVGSVVQPMYGGGCHPTMLLRTGASTESEPWGEIEGPCLFGGCSEFCCDFHFFASFFHSPARSGDAGAILKRKPGSWSQGFTEMFSPADNYTIEFAPTARLSVLQKLTIVAGQLLADYLYFDGNTEKCRDSSSSFDIYCFYCSIYGCICPCVISFPKK